MSIISVFNNKGGVGKTTLAFHFSCALAGLGKKVLVIDLDPQCNLTINFLEEEVIHGIWEKEDPFIDDYLETFKAIGKEKKNDILNDHGTIHFALKPVEDGVESDEPILPKPINVFSRLDIIPGRLSIHTFENALTDRWPLMYSKDPLAIRTVTQIRKICEHYKEKYGYDYIIVDTSPSLSTLNKVIISTVDGFIIPCQPDLFSLYGIRNIGNALKKWKDEFETLYTLLPPEKWKHFPGNFVKFLGYTVYNARKYTKQKTKLAQAHKNFEEQIGPTIAKYINSSTYSVDKSTIMTAIGEEGIKFSHNTLPSMAQKYRCPIWKVPTCGKIERDDRNTILGNRKYYENTKQIYEKFAQDVIARIS